MCVPKKYDFKKKMCQQLDSNLNTVCCGFQRNVAKVFSLPLPSTRFREQTEAYCICLVHCKQMQVACITLGYRKKTKSFKFSKSRQIRLYRDLSLSLLINRLINTFGSMLNFINY